MYILLNTHTLTLLFVNIGNNTHNREYYTDYKYMELEFDMTQIFVPASFFNLFIITINTCIQCV